MNIQVRRRCDPIGHGAQSGAIDETLLGPGGAGPAIVSRDRDAAGSRRAGAHREGRQRRQGSSTEKRAKSAASHSISLSPMPPPEWTLMILPRGTPRRNHMCRQVRRRVETGLEATCALARDGLDYDGVA